MALSASVSGGVAVVVVDTWPWVVPDVETGDDCVAGGVLGLTTVSFLHAASRNIAAKNIVDVFINLCLIARVKAKSGL